MTAFTELEGSVLRSIISELPELAPGLMRQLAAARVNARENTGAGFYTYFSVADGAPRVDAPRQLGDRTHARIEGLDYPFGFLLFLADGQMHMLEGFSYGESIERMDLASVKFEIYFEDAAETCV